MRGRISLLREPSSRRTLFALASVVILNSMVVVGEAIAGYHANSLSIAADALHNCSDELALFLLFLAFWRFGRFDGRLGTTANLLNSLGIIVVAITIVALAAQRIGAPPEVSGGITLATGLAAAAGNLAVAAVLRSDSRRYTEIRLAYLHNLGDVALCLSTAASGLFILMFEIYWLDCAFAVSIAALLLICTARECLRTSNANNRHAASINDTPGHIPDAPAG